MSDFKFYINKFGFVDAMLHLGMWSIIWYRIGHALIKSRFRKINPLWYLYLVFNYLLMIITHIELSPSSVIGKNLLFPHPYGIIIGPNVKIGNDVCIGPWVLFGHNFGNKAPVIEDDCYIGAKSSIIGNITIGQRCFIGLNMVVSASLPAGSVVSVYQPFPKTK